MLKRFLPFLCFLLTANPVSAELTQINQVISVTGPNTALQDKKLYQLKVECQAVGSLRNINTVSGVFSQTTYTISHTVLVATEQPTLNDGGESNTIQKNIVAVIPSYAVRAEDRKDNRRSCGGVWFVVGGSPYYVIAAKSQSETYKPSLFTRVIFKIPDLIPPLWSLFKTGELPKEVESTLGNVKKVEDPLNKLLETFNNSQTITETRELKQATYSIQTQFSRVKITVAPMDSFVPQYAFKLKQQLDGGEKLAANDDLPEKCGSIADKLADRGVSEETDIPFSLAYLASRAFPTSTKKTKVLDCLSADHAMKAVKLGKVLWQFVTGDSRHLTQGDVEGHFGVPLDQVPAQPRFAVMQDRIDHFITYMSKMTFDDPPSGDFDQLLRVTAPKITLIDKLTQKRLENWPTPEADLKSVIEYLKQQKYKRFGCYKQNAAENMSDQSIVTILAFKAEKGESTTKFSDALALRPIFVGSKFSRILVYDNPDLMRPILTEKSFQCYGLTITQ